MWHYGFAFCQCFHSYSTNPFSDDTWLLSQSNCPCFSIPRTLLSMLIQTLPYNKRHNALIYLRIVACGVRIASSVLVHLIEPRLDLACKVRVGAKTIWMRGGPWRGNVLAHRKPGCESLYYILVVCSRFPLSSVRTTRRL